MENFFAYDFVGDTLWFDEPVVANPSAFVSYTGRHNNEGLLGRIQEKDHRNIKKRMVEFLMRSRDLNETDKERCRKHMVSERMRREKQKRSYLELFSLLPSGTKRDKNSIITMAAEKVKELKRSKEESERQKSALENVLAARRRNEEMVEQASIKIRVAYPSSGVDSMLEVLKCLKQTSSKTTAIQSTFSAQELSAVLGIETKVGAAEVEKAVHRTLFEVERKFHNHPPGY